MQKSQNKLGELSVLGVAVLVLFGAFIWLAGLEGEVDTPESAGSSTSHGKRGTLALYRWLERSGFDVSRVEAGQEFPPDADTLFMVNPNNDFPEGQAGSVKRWVEDGHTLVLAVSSNSSFTSGLGGRHPMFRELNVDMDFAGRYTDTVAVAQPLFSRPPVSQVKMRGSFRIDVPLGNSVVLVASTDEEGAQVPLAAILKVGSGRVIALASDYPLSNEGIREEENGGFAYNLAQMAGGSRVAFDEAHHGAGAEGGDLITLLTSNPWGWALLYGVGMVGIYLFWSARRLGPPLPVRSPDERRPTSDYVTSVAGLFRRARKPGYAAERYLKFFKRTLSRHAELDPYLTDTRFVQSLQERGRHTFNPDEMLRAIQQLRQLEGGGEGAPGSESMEFETLNAIREAEKVRREALGIRQETL